LLRSSHKSLGTVLILQHNLKKGIVELDGGTDWIDLAQDRDRWQALVNAVMKLRGFIKYGEISD
jgi:hypothetical protein